MPLYDVLVLVMYEYFLLLLFKISAIHTCLQNVTVT